MAKTTLHFNGENSSRANTAFTIGVFTILAALCFEYIGGYTPCELCLVQRLPYYIGLPLLAVILGMWKQLPVMSVRIPATLVVAGLFVWGTYMGGFHAGVEWGFWPGPTSCTGAAGGLDFSALNNINATKIVPCDVVQWQLLGISFAGYNALISALIAGFLFWSAQGQWQRVQTNKKKAAQG